MKKGLEMEEWLESPGGCGTCGGTHLAGDSEAEAQWSSKKDTRAAAAPSQTA